MSNNEDFFFKEEIHKRLGFNDDHLDRPLIQLQLMALSWDPQAGLESTN